MATPKLLATGRFLLVALLLSYPAYSDPDLCQTLDSTTTCSEDQSHGVSATTPTTTNLIVDELTTDIEPVSGVTGIRHESKGRNGDSGGTYPIVGGSGDNGRGGSTVNTSVFDTLYSISTLGDNAHGIHSSSVGGNGGAGGNGFGIVIPLPPFWTPGYGGDGGDGANGGPASVFNSMTISTAGNESIGIFASSRGGHGGHGGWGVGLWGVGGDGGYGGKGGNVIVTNDGTILTEGVKSHGIFAESVGGAGGDGGEGYGVVGKGADGGGNADSGTVQVDNSGNIETQGEGASAIQAWSIGGGKNEGGAAGGLFSWGGDGSAAGHANTVTVNNTGSLITQGSEASAIYAESLGGGGGKGGDAGSVGPVLTVAVGGSGGPGGDGKLTTVTSSEGPITTGEDPENPDQWNSLVRNSHGIFASSKGGGGGQGGFAFSVAVSNTFSAALAFGGSGGDGGDGGDVMLDNSSALTTYGDESHGLFAQSLGGGGGNGGFAFAGSLGGNGSLSVTFGGTGGSGGDGSLVDVNSENSILTKGIGSYGIFAQSVGGGGGSGGDSISISGSGVASGSLSMGGDGSDGGHGGLLVEDDEGNLIRQGIIVDSSSDITTFGDTAHGILAQSIGGGGGDGGMAISGSFASTAAAAVALGGGGGTGGDAGRVDLSNSGTINTSGYEAHGIFAQSTGKGGGSGGMSISGTLTFSPKGSAGAGVSLGGSGGGGGKGDNVTVVNDGSIYTSGDDSIGINAQSVGGGGGRGGFSFAGGISGPKSLNAQVSIGGSGGTGNTGGIVDVTNDGLIQTSGFQSHGIFAQSTGGGGGSGGTSVAATLGLVDKTVGIGVAVGGSGGDGAVGQMVKVRNNDTITTFGKNAFGIYAQSIGGGGGQGGSAFSGSVALTNPDAKFTANLNFAFGGSGGTGNVGGDVDIYNDGLIETWETNSHGIFAQSVGGGGGAGGSARTMSLSTCWWECAAPIKPKTSAKKVAFKLSMGGSGGTGGHGGNVTVNNFDDVITHGTDSHGIWAQSVGGGGGSGGEAAHGFWGVSIPGLDKTKAYSDVSILIGGSGGASGRGGDVTVNNIGSITTFDDGSFGAFAQSVGGGGGQGGHGATGLTGKVGIGGKGGSSGDGGDVTVDITGDIDTFGGSAHGIFAQSVGGGGGLAGNVTRGLGDLNFGIGLGITRDAGNGGDGGIVKITSSGNITTHGDASIGIFTQSVGGGGGLAGDNGTGFGFAGSAGGDGAGGAISVNHSGTITTLGDYSHGIFAQSGGGAADDVAILDEDGKTIGYLTDRQDLGGNIDITLNGQLTATGANSNGLFLQSKGADGNGDITVNIVDVDGLVMGGSGSSAGIFLADGVNNSITNYGLVGSAAGVSGNAVISTYGNDRVENHGTVIGNVDLAAGNNYFVNYGLVKSGSNFYMGAGNRLLNEGNFSIGGIDNVWTTVFDGDFEQNDEGTLWFDIDFDYGADMADRLDIRGSANLDGALALALHNAGKIAPGDQDFVLITSSNSFDTANLELFAPVSAVVDFNLYNPSETQYALSYNVDFAASGLNRNQAAMGEHFNAIQLAGGTATDMQALVASIVEQPDVESLATAYDLLSPHIYAANQVSGLFSSLDFAQAMMSCPIKDGDYRFSREGSCTWMRISDRDIEYEASGGGLGATDYTQTVNFGFQTALTDRWHGGLAFGLEDSEYKIPLASRRDGRLAQMGAILKGRYGASQFNISATMGMGDYQIYRDIGMPYADDEYTRRDLSFYSAHLGYSYSIESGRWYLRPGFDAGWLKVDGEGFKEVMTGPAALEVMGTDDSYLTTRIDLQIGAEFGSPDNVLYRPYLKTAWTHVNPDSANEIHARLSGAPASVPFFTQVLETDKDFVNVSLGMQMFLERNWAFNVVYDHTSAGDWDGQSYYAKVQYAF
ncbi:MAG: autotransporter outer membrane beta-barrel domain-containing protein [Gammaproteobacteria bacterium]|nr:autotransporter outer membrane beta-barrel domain-containing protein [Gammaproteobacteria bacterium]NNL45677.1 autotransporter outer membrane beta-barrel domain-containing protein [Woeseiaceae bacterium]